MRLRKFTPKGLEWFQDFRADRFDERSALSSILVNREFAGYADCGLSVTRQDFLTRFAVGKYCYELLHPAGSRSHKLDVETWAWLAALHFDVLCPVGSSPGDHARWVPALGNFRQYYRHLLAGPYLIYRAHHDNPTSAMALLANEPHRPGDIAEQLASRQELVANPTVVGVATSLYVSPTTQKIKPFAAGKGPGSARRFAVVLNQLDLIWDLWQLGPQQLLDLLPGEFDRFRS